MSRRVGVVAGLFALLAVSVVQAPAALAADSCTFTSGEVTVNFEGGYSQASPQDYRYLLIRRSGTAIEFRSVDTNGTQTPIGCGATAPTVSNTDTVIVSMTHASFAAVFVSMFYGTFNPTGSTSAIDFTIDLSVPEHGGEISVGGTTGADRVVAGATGINLDGDQLSDLNYLGEVQLSLVGGGGDDYLSLNGGNGTGDPSDLPSTSNGGAGDDVMYGGTSIDRLAGGADNDRVYGGDGGDLLGLFSNWVDADPGNDRIYGQGGNDDIGGDLGNDLLIGGAGRDDLYGNGGVDTVSYAGAISGVRASIDNARNDGTFISNVSEGDLIDSSVENLIGSNFADRLSGSTGGADIRNVLTGGGGNDLLNGLDGNDVLHGNAGANTLNGGFGTDVINGGSVKDVISGGPGGDTANGNGGNDEISGNDGNDHLFGHGGGDFLHGGDDTDECVGGPGADTVRMCETP